MGYAGGTTTGPTYHALGDHSEAVEVAYDPTRVTYERLLHEFWAAHDPTRSASRQYRSAIFVHDEAQREVAERSLRATELRLGDEVATAIEPAGTFTPAEDYHQKWELRHVGAVWREVAAAYPAVDDLVRSTAAARMNAWVAGYGTEADLRIDDLGLSPEGRRALLAAR